MRPLAEISNQEVSEIRGICLDIDDTLSTHGKLTAEAYQALWNLKNAGYFIVPITGRPAGWCDHIIRFWPVDAVVGENGAFTFYMKDKVRSRIETPGALADATVRAKKLHDLGQTILKEFPHAKWASDQAYREHDLAIDFCEDVPPWPRADIDRLVEVCHQVGAQAKISSIHVNSWFGTHNKCSGFEAWKQAGFQGLVKGTDIKHDQWIFIGDSPNDEPMFEYFSKSVGVANLAPFLDRIKNPPRWITQHESGNGFVEFAEKLLCTKK